VQLEAEAAEERRRTERDTRWRQLQAEEPGADTDGVLTVKFEFTVQASHTDDTGDHAAAAVVAGPTRATHRFLPTDRVSRVLDVAETHPLCPLRHTAVRVSSFSPRFVLDRAALTPGGDTPSDDTGSDSNNKKGADGDGAAVTDDVTLAELGLAAQSKLWVVVITSD